MSATQRFNFGGLGNFKGMGFGARVAGMLPRVKSNSMLLGRFLPDTMNVMNNVEAKSTGTVFVPYCLSIGAPRGGFSMPSASGGFSGLGGGLGGFSKRTAANVNSVWALYDAQMAPQMFIAISERTATVGTVQAKFIDAEFAKAKPDAMSLSVFKDNATMRAATTFPAAAGYAKFTWQMS